MARLEQAMRIWLEYSDGGREVAEADWLAANEDVRDLLEPLLHGDVPDGARAPGTIDGEVPTADGLAPGTVFGEFRVLRTIGRGGMGIVVEARQTSLDRNVALKVLAPHIASNPKSMARFRREALTAARLDHAAIVDVYSVGESAGVQWFAMELIDGPPLNEYAAQLRETHPTDHLRQIVRLVVSVCRAVDHAHLSGVVHRDLKPSNILVRGDGSPVITDFGLSRELDLPSITRTREFAGTPYYVAPEQLRGGAGTVGPRADVFALGVTLYEITTARRPFEGPSTQAVFHEILHRDPIPPDQVETTIPRDLAAVISHALEKREEDRYPSAAEFADDLERFLRGGPVHARYVGPLARAFRYVRRDPVRLTAAIAVACAVLALTTFGVYVWWTDRATSAGQQVLTTGRVETLFLDAVVAPYCVPERDGRSPGADEKARLIATAMQLGSDDPYVVLSVVYYTMRLGGPSRREESARRALKILESVPHAMQQGFAMLQLRKLLLERLDRRDEAEELAGRIGPPRTALDHYFLAELQMTGVGHGVASHAEPALTSALEHAQKAVAMMARPRSTYLLQLKRTALASGDKVSELIAVDAMVEHWPNSAAAWAHRALSYEHTDPAIAEAAAKRSLELRPDNLFGLAILGQIAHARGNESEAKRLMGRAETLYPRGCRFFLLGEATPKSQK